MGVDCVWAFCLFVSTHALALTDLPIDNRDKINTVENPLVLSYPFPSGTKAELHVVNYPGGKSDLFFFHMHVNETTAKKAGEESVRANGGTFMYLVQQQKDGRNRSVDVSLRIELEPAFSAHFGHRHVPYVHDSPSGVVRQDHESREKSAQYRRR